MVIELNTKTHSINTIYATDEQNPSSEQKKQMHLDAAGLIVHAMVKSAESSYTDMDLQKVYIDLLAAYAKRVIDPEREMDNFDVSARIREIRESEEVSEV